ncbi:MAG: glycosyltransferase, partial [Nocardioides sp.]
MPGLGLHMIVKDEAHVIERCLRSVRPLVDWWVVCDTGSSDATPELVRRTMAGIPGRLLERPWVSFGHNRQESLDAARELPESASDDYVMFIDADEELIDLPDCPPELTADGYHLEVEHAAARYARLAVVRLDRPWRWTGAIHEYLDLPGADLGAWSRPRVRARREGARSQDPDTYRKDAALIEAELARDPDDPRMQFYLGQSWRDAGEIERALEAYRVRAANPSGWDQERWCALFEIGRCLAVLGRDADEVSSAYLAAFAALPSRAEPLVELARHERERGRFEVALLYARPA